MVFTEIGRTTLIFALPLFLSKTREQLRKIMGEREVDEHMGMLSSAFFIGDIYRHNVESYELVSRLMYEKIVKDEIGLNAETVC